MKVVIAPDSFKGSMTSIEAANSISKGLHAIEPSVECVHIPMADGGEGTVDALLVSTGGEKVYVSAEDPLGRSIGGFYGWLAKEQTAVIETAAASGLVLLRDDELNAELASTYGTGQLIRDALNKEAKRIIIGLGGSATVDGGVGCLQALGVRFFDHQGSIIERVGGNLHQISGLDTTHLDKRLDSVEFVIASDVNNELLGDTGAIYVFGAQKGVRPERMSWHEQGMANFAQVVVDHIGKDFRLHAGSGAAGGLGFGLLSFFNCQLQSGFELVASLARLEEQLQNADFVITGEGSIDAQSLYGKVPVGIAQLAKRYDVPTIAFGGKISADTEALHKIGVSLVLPIIYHPTTLLEAIKNGPNNLELASRRLMQTLLLAKTLKNVM